MNLDTPCEISPHGKVTGGYAKLTHNGKEVYHHRLVYVQSRGITLEDIKGLDIRHKCDNPPCVNASHLEAGTRQDNVDDMHKRGRAHKARGEVAPKAKLKEADVLFIRARPAMSCLDLAKEYGVSHTCIIKIRNRKSWTHI